MSLIDWLRSKFGGAVSLSYDQAWAAEYAQIAGEVYVREMAFLACINLIANAVSKCEFKTYENSEEVKGAEYYLWNVEPNKNQNSTEFIREWVAKLYIKNECLIIENNNQLLIADSFDRKQYAVYEDIFTNVTVKDFTFNRSFKMSEVLYFKSAATNINRVLNGLYESYSKMIAYSMTAYQRSKGTKAKFNYETLPVAGTPEREQFDKLINERFKAFLSSDSAIVPLGKGQDLDEFSTGKTYSAEGTRDIRAMINDVMDFTANSLSIPPVLLRGDVQGTKDAVDNFLTFCIDNLTDMFSEEINRKRNQKINYLRGTYLVIDTKTIKHVDVLSVSTAIDKLISSGVFCINDIRKLLGEAPIDEPWAWKHWMTKNYTPAQEAALALSGGDSDAQ